MSATRILLAVAAVLSATAASAAQADTAAATPPEPAARIHRSYAAELVVLADEFRRERIFNESENLLLAARDWGRSDPWKRVLDRRLEALRAERKTWWPDGPREDYRRFVESKKYAATRARLMREREELDARAAKRALDAAMKALGEQREADAEALLDFVSRVHADVARRLAGNAKRVWKRVRDRHAAAGLARLELGETTSRIDVSLDDLEGKVVLWRSKSL